MNLAALIDKEKQSQISVSDLKRNISKLFKKHEKDGLVTRDNIGSIFKDFTTDRKLPLMTNSQLSVIYKYIDPDFDNKITMDTITGQMQKIHNVIIMPLYSKIENLLKIEFERNDKTNKGFVTKKGFTKVFDN